MVKFTAVVDTVISDASVLIAENKMTYSQTGYSFLGIIGKL